ncbi:MAG: beta-N-acetylhexosaminidase, partial [Gammaproteobacteria bacterium]|nr:beta-N-acetylhexosaminidase [Gammaproteobacteria bacterium]
SVGVDFSFAPVLDVAHTQSDVIGDRAFHSTPEIVSRLARAWVDGMNAAGMAATGKHFPGHGGVSLDSHACLPCDERDLAQIETLDLLPFVRLAPILSGIMTAHVLFQAVDAAVPTYSPRWLKEILRRRLGFTGVIFSDDLTMQGAATESRIEDRVSRALTAGCDMALICNDLPAADRALDRASRRVSPDLAARLAAMRGPATQQFALEPLKARKIVTQLTEMYS